MKPGYLDKLARFGREGDATAQDILDRTVQAIKNQRARFANQQQYGSPTQRDAAAEGSFLLEMTAGPVVDAFIAIRDPIAS